MYKPKHKERSSKCLVFVLVVFVILCALVLVSACILRVTSPEIKLTAATLNKISYSSSPSASFNATVTTHLSIRNPNYGGGFSYENSKVIMCYYGLRVGDRVISSDTVKARENHGMNVTINVRSGKLPIGGNLTSDINSSGMLNLTSYAKFSGTVELLKIFNKRKSIEMACTMNLNLTSHAVQGIQCE